MPKKPQRREKSLSRQISALQCQYPGKFSSERALKANGEVHWLCDGHRDHQNALQRERYKRTGKKKKNRVQTAPSMTTSTPVKRASQSSLANSESNLQRGYHAVKGARGGDGARSCGPFSPSDSPCRCKTNAPNRVRAERRNDVPAPNALDSSQVQVTQGPSQVAASAPLMGVYPVAPHAQVPQMVYILVQAVPLAVGAQAQVLPSHLVPWNCSTDSTGPVGGHAYLDQQTQRQHSATPVSRVQYAVTPTDQSCFVSTAENSVVPRYPEDNRSVATEGSTD